MQQARAAGIPSADLWARFAAYLYSGSAGLKNLCTNCKPGIVRDSVVRPIGSADRPADAHTQQHIHRIAWIIQGCR